MSRTQRSCEATLFHAHTMEPNPGQNLHPVMSTFCGHKSISADESLYTWRNVLSYIYNLRTHSCSIHRSWRITWEIDSLQNESSIGFVFDFCSRQLPYYMDTAGSLIFFSFYPHTVCYSSSVLGPLLHGMWGYHQSSILAFFSLLASVYTATSSFEGGSIGIKYLNCSQN